MTSVFISYSSQDREWADRLRAHLEPVRRTGLIDLWDDARIDPGSRWTDEIGRAIDEAKFAVLLVSPAYLASRHLSTIKSRLLVSARSGGADILQVFVTRPRVEDVLELSFFQAVNSPETPLAALSHVEQERVLGDLVRRITLGVTQQTGSGSSQPPDGESVASQSESASADPPEVVTSLKAQQVQDGLAAARRRGAAAQQDILRREGGVLTPESIAELLGVPTAVVEEWRRAGRLVGVQTGPHDYAYPAWQVTRDGLLPGIGEVLAAMPMRDPWVRAGFFVSGDPRLNGETPVTELRRGNIAAVIRAASAYGEHGAA